MKGKPILVPVKEPKEGMKVVVQNKTYEIITIDSYTAELEEVSTRQQLVAGSKEI